MKQLNEGPPRLGTPKCHPGTITYHDALVRHLGYDRRKADQMQRAWRDGELKKLPVLS